MKEEIEILIGDKVLKAGIEGGIVQMEGETEPVCIEQVKAGVYKVFVGKRVYDVFAVTDERKGTKEVALELGGNRSTAVVKDSYDKLLEKMGIAGASAKKAADLKAPMPGLVREVLVKVGDEVQKGSPLLVLEAMKMENTVKATAEGKVSQVLMEVGKAVEKGQILIKFA